MCSISLVNRKAKNKNFSGVRDVVVIDQHDVMPSCKACVLASLSSVDPKLAGLGTRAAERCQVQCANPPELRAVIWFSGRHQWPIHDPITFLVKIALCKLHDPSPSTVMTHMPFTGSADPLPVTLFHPRRISTPKLNPNNRDNIRSDCICASWIKQLTHTPCMASPLNERHFSVGCHVAFYSTHQGLPQLPQEALAMRSQSTKLPEMFGCGYRVPGLWEAVYLESWSGESGEDDGEGV